jgi:hypothetical protein
MSWSLKIGSIIHITFILQGSAGGSVMTDGPKKMVWDYVDANHHVGHPDRLKMFATPEAADDWFKENDPEGVVFG